MFPVFLIHFIKADALYCASIGLFCPEDGGRMFLQKTVAVIFIAMRGRDF
jgi:hypothetical protein